MKSRAISALVFGLCFSIIFTGISFFAPKYQKTYCEPGTFYEFSGFTLPPTDELCGVGSYRKAIGLPFASRVQKELSTFNVGGPEERSKSGFNVSTSGFIGNLFAYWLFGFIFFFIFSRSRNAGKKKKANKNQM